MKMMVNSVVDGKAYRSDEIELGICKFRGYRHTSVRASIVTHTENRFNDAAVLLRVLEAEVGNAAVEVHLTNDFKTPGSNGVWFARRFRSRKLAEEFVSKIAADAANLRNRYPFAA